jgi:hypothetical protein
MIPVDIDIIIISLYPILSRLSISFSGNCALHLRLDTVFETPPAVPKPPTIDQLYNHGTTAFPKRSETKNPRMEHNNFWA